MRGDDTEFQRALKAVISQCNALFDRYPKQKVLGALLGALQDTPIRSGPKRKNDTQLLIVMGRVIAWRKDLSIRAAAEIATRHLPNNKYRLSVIDRVRKYFAAEKSTYLRAGKIYEIVHLLMAEREEACSNVEGLAQKPFRRAPPLTLLRTDDALEATFQELRSELQAVYMKAQIFPFPEGLGGIRHE
jgi:hypothetical protein